MKNCSSKINAKYANFVTQQTEPTDKEKSKHEK